MALGPTQLDSLRGYDVSDSEYYKKLQKELREKRGKAAAEQNPDQANRDPVAEEVTHDLHESRKSKEVSHKRVLPAIAQEAFEDDVQLSQESQEQFDNLFKLNEDEAHEKSETLKAFEDELKQDGSKILQFFSQKIDFQKKQPELKKLYKEVITQSRSDNPLLSKYGRFKVSVVGHILSLTGVSPDEIKTLKREAIAAAFKENTELMEDNIYNTELAELLYGRKNRKNKNSLELFESMRNTLIQKMVNIGRPGYWSDIRLQEERITQCQKILEEFQKELHDLKYQYAYHLQDSGKAYDNIKRPA